ncbi:MAG TPA: FkbM family methyltransferase [Bryobacteraceae bacterium]
MLRYPMEVAVSVKGIVHPVYVRLRTTDVSLLSELVNGPEYDLDFRRPPRVIVDAGANIGLTSAFFAAKYPGARVFAIEPEPSNFRILKKNAAAYKNIACVEAALWQTDGSLALSDPGLGHWGFQATDAPQTGSAGAGMEVEGVTISTLMARWKIDYIDFLRVDIEGAELQVFEDPSSWIHRVGAIAIELHDRLAPGCSRTVYRATEEFQWNFRRGETVFFGRGEKPTSEGAREPHRATESPNSSSATTGRRNPCRILSVVDNRL